MRIARAWQSIRARQRRPGHHGAVSVDESRPDDVATDPSATLDSPGLTRAHLGWALFHETRYVDAAKELRQAVQFQPNMCVATYRLGRVYFAREEWEKAAELFQSTSDDSACGSQEASLYLMKTRMQQGLVDDARRARDACLKMSPTSCLASQCRAEGRSLGALASAAGTPHP